MSDEGIDDDLNEIDNAKTEALKETKDGAGPGKDKAPPPPPADKESTKSVDDYSNAEWSNLSDDEKSTIAKKTEERAKNKIRKLKKPETTGGTEGGDDAQKAAAAAAKKTDDAAAAAEAAKKKTPEENSAYARMRKAEKEAADLKKQQEEREVAAAARRKEAEAAGKSDVEPNKADNPEAWYEWKTRQLEKENAELKSKFSEVDSFVGDLKKERQVTEAEKELVAIEKDFAKTHPDYDKAVEHMAHRMLRAKLDLEPWKSEDQIIKETKELGLMIAANAYADGKNPADVLYDMAINRYGYKAPDPAAGDDGDGEGSGDGGAGAGEEENPAAKMKPGANLKALNEAKKRSASGLSGGGRGAAGKVSAAAALEMSNAEFSRLPQAEKERILREARPGR